ncbi:hypothetical protein KJ840_04725 [Patescibacteria group bacterium]|nr:hypothetical protein [Patescibacteria group bacterium]
MGKHERKLIEEAEKFLVSLLNKEGIDEVSLRENPWWEYVVELTGFISREYSNIVTAQHLGNSYDNTGDILLKLSSGKEIYIEIKMSATKSGIGTKANISQNALTNGGLFKNDPKSWSDFRSELRHDTWVDGLLNKHKNYPSNINNIKNKKIRLEEKARYLRKLAEGDNGLAKNILDKIRFKDRKEKIVYLNYLKKQKQDPEMIKRFFILLEMGIHKDEEIKDLIIKDNFFQEIQNLYVYYVNYDGRKILIKKENVGNKIQKIIKRFLGFKIVFPKLKTHCKIIGITKKGDIPLLQVVYHWKNIAQGIKTPCLNIFDLTNRNQ